jgi:hypothetical protein
MKWWGSVVAGTPKPNVGRMDWRGCASTVDLVADAGVAAPASAYAAAPDPTEVSFDASPVRFSVSVLGALIRAMPKSSEFA